MARCTTSASVWIVPCQVYKADTQLYLYLFRAPLDITTVTTFVSPRGPHRVWCFVLPPKFVFASDSFLRDHITLVFSFFFQVQPGGIFLCMRRSELYFSYHPVIQLLTHSFTQNKSCCPCLYWDISCSQPQLVLIYPIAQWLSCIVSFRHQFCCCHFSLYVDLFTLLLIVWLHLPVFHRLTKVITAINHHQYQ